MEMGKEMVKPNENTNADFYARKVAVASSENVEAVRKAVPAGDTFTVSGVDLNSIPGMRIGNMVIHNTGIAFGRFYNSPETMPKEANTYLYVDNGQVRLANYKDGQRTSDIGIMESIADIQVLNKKVVMVTFSDGKVEKAVLDTYDTFNIEQGIAICIMKKSFSKISNDNGSSVYNKLVEYGLKAYNDILAAESKAEAKKKEKEAKAKRNAEKAKRKRARKAAEKREAEIEIQKEAYLRAMRELNDTSNTVAAK